MKPQDKSYDEEHPEQDPAEGSRETIDHDLADAGAKEKKGDGREAAAKKDGGS